ncbi:MAG: L-ribulose-5-phosphate 4-epimerase [Bacilli bacterium]|jgi:L-ribulose-5-phosphate 4-epimerase
MLEKLKKRVWEQNLRLRESGLVTLTWGNVSAIDRRSGLVVIKPSGVPYCDMKADDMVVTDLDGRVVEGQHRPSSDLFTHLELYKAFKEIGGVTHTHSTYATAYAQSGKDITAYGTTHADTFYGDIPCTRALTAKEIETDYELNTGKVIVETFKNKDYQAIPAVMIKNHGPFTWGTSPEEAVENAIILEEVAKIAALSERINPNIEKVDEHLLRKHYERKHGKDAYYGQKKDK